jgi:Flp pilus assembly pilin Flp
MRISNRKANCTHRLLGQARGATLMEYALLVALGSVILIIALLAFSGFKN